MNETEIKAEDIELAKACLRGEGVALGELEALVVEAGEVLDSAGTFMKAQVLDTLRAQLLAGSEDDRPALARYRGREPLRAFLRVAAYRIASQQPKLTS